MIEAGKVGTVFKKPGQFEGLFAWRWVIWMKVRAKTN